LSLSSEGLAETERYISEDRLNTPSGFDLSERSPHEVDGIAILNYGVSERFMVFADERIINLKYLIF